MAKRDLRRERLNKIRDKIDKKTSVSRRKEVSKTARYPRGDEWGRYRGIYPGYGTG